MLDKSKNIFGKVIDILFKVLPLVISVIALWNTMVLNKKFIEPNVRDKLDFISLALPGGFTEDKTLPEYNIHNIGPVKVVSLSIDHFIFDINLNMSKVVLQKMLGIEDVGNHFMYEKELNVFDIKKKVSERFYYPDNTVRVCLFDIQYFRESDMKKYTHRDMFFIDNNQIYFSKNYNEANENKYNTIMNIIGDIDKRISIIVTRTPRQIKGLIVK